MYQQFFQFRRLPFQPTPDPNFFFFTSRHEEAFNEGLYAITERKGFMVLTGEVGTGKTTLSRLLIEQLGPRVKSSLIFNPNLTTVELLQSINHDFGLPDQSYSKKVLTDELNQFLLEQLMQDGNAVLIIDEAQTLSVDCLEEVRLLSNLETPRAKLLQILLIGQPELMDKLALPQLRQLNQRIVVRAHLTPLEPQEVADYIRYRLWRAGGREAVHFEPAALELVYRYSGGVPRLINALCDRALLAAYVRSSRLISGYVMSQAIEELTPMLPVTEPPPPHLTQETPVPSVRPRYDATRPVAAIGLALLLIGVGAMWWNSESIEQHFPSALLAREQPATIMPPPVELPPVPRPSVGETFTPRRPDDAGVSGDLHHDVTAGEPAGTPTPETTPPQPSLPQPSLPMASGTSPLTPPLAPTDDRVPPVTAPASAAVRIPLLPTEVIMPSNPAPASPAPSSASTNGPQSPRPALSVPPLVTVSESPVQGGAVPEVAVPTTPPPALKVDHHDTRTAAVDGKTGAPSSVETTSATPPALGQALPALDGEGGAAPQPEPAWSVDGNDVIRADTPELMERAALLMLLHQWGAMPDWPPMRPNGLVNADPATLARERRLELLQLPLSGHDLLKLNYPAIVMRRSQVPGRPPHPVVVTRVVNDRVILLDPGAGMVTRPAAAIDREVIGTVRLYWRPLNGWRWPGSAEGTDPVVRWLQSRLHDRRIYRGPIDGLAGPGTEEALRKWASQRGLTIAASGPLMDLLISQLLEPAGFPQLSIPNSGPDSGPHAGRDGAGKAPSAAGRTAG
ncbi:MAG TPA: AAA family ATPase [Nitrospiria bacterium]|nr:AAA family ATPase [Nitrospiria bacterium]